MKTELRIFVPLLVCAAAFAGCGSPGTGAVDDFVVSLATAQCAFEFRCCTDAEIQQQEMGKYKDQATCVQFHELALEDAHYAEKLAVRQGRIKVDSAQASACLAAQNALACNPAPGSPAPPPAAAGTVDPCTLVFKGATKVGDACEFANECVKGAQCVPTGAAGQGVCVPYQQAAQICNSNADCDPSVFNLYCAKKDFQCHLRSELGGPCAYTIDPASMTPTTPLTLECDTSAGTLFCDPTTLTCQNLPGSGQPCLVPPLPPGLGSTCAAGLVCDTATTGTGGTCRGPGNIGDDCTRIACMTTLYCDRTLTPNTCKALPALGEDCQTSGFICAKPYYCNTAMPPYVCAQPAELGQACSNTIICDTDLYCDQTTAAPTCKTRLPDGSACTQSKMCESNLCSFAGVTGTCASTGVVVQCIGR